MAWLGAVTARSVTVGTDEAQRRRVTRDVTVGVRAGVHTRLSDLAAVADTTALLHLRERLNQPL